MTVIRFKMCCSTRNVIKIRHFFAEMWWLNDFQSGGRPPSCILKICSFCHVAFAGMPFRFLIQNFAEIGQSVDELWPKERFSRWRPPLSWVFTVFQWKIIRFWWNHEIWRFNDKFWILKFARFVHVAFIGMPFLSFVNFNFWSRDYQYI